MSENEVFPSWQRLEVFDIIQTNPVSFLIERGTPSPTIHLFTLENMKRLISSILLVLCSVPLATASMEPISDSLLSQLFGTWEAVGYGKFLQISNGRLREYHSNSHGCIDTADQTQAQLRTDYAYIDIIDANSFFASPLPFGNKWLFTKTTPLPNCRERNNATALQTFDFFDAFMKSHYAYFAEREMDWTIRSSAVRNTLLGNVSPQELYDAMDGLLRELGDPHTGLYAVLNDQLVHRLGLYPRHAMSKIRAANTGGSKNDDDLFLDWIIGQLTELEAKMINVGNIIDTTPFYWAKFGEIGYLHIGSEGGFATTGKLEDEIQGVEAALDRALTDLADSEAIIVDLTLNLGGYEWISQTIARRFAAAPIHIHSKSMHNAPSVPDLDFVLEPSQRPSYHGPLYLLTSDITVSAGEDLTLSLRTLPQTRHYGLATYGALSNVLPKPLPNGWGLTLSNEIYTDANGEVWESRGISPDFEYNLYAGGIKQSHYAMIQGFVSHITQARALVPQLTASLDDGLVLTVDKAEPGSTLSLLQSEDLSQWEQVLSWQYTESMQFEIDYDGTDEAQQIFFRVKEVN